MGVVNHLQQFYIPFDAEHFIESHKDCPQDVALLHLLFRNRLQIPFPRIFWRAHYYKFRQIETVK